MYSNMYVNNSDAINMHLHTRGIPPHAAAVWWCSKVEISHKYFKTLQGIGKVGDGMWKCVVGGGYAHVVEKWESMCDVMGGIMSMCTCIPVDIHIYITNDIPTAQHHGQHGDMWAHTLAIHHCIFTQSPCRHV